MCKEPYGTRPGGACWHDKVLDILQPMDFLQHPLFWKGETSELTAKTKGNDRIFTKKLGLSLMVEEGTPNPNVSLKGYPKKFWGLLDKVAHKTQQITLFQSRKRRFILNPNGPRTDLQP